MNKEFIPYYQALALKELGFDEPCLGVYYESKTFYIYTKSKGVKNSDKTSQSWVFTAPLYQQAFRWFRENHNLSGFTLPWGEGLFDYRIYSTKEGEHLFGSPEYSSTEEAELACLKKLIEIVKTK
jgi:hypothetical protein